MQLITANLRRYRSIEDGSEFTVEPDVTCLVGKNESGKTAVLQGLYKSYPVNKSKFDEGLDYPSRMTRERKEKGKLRVAKLTYELDESEVEMVEERFGTGVLKSRTITMTTGYRYEGSSTWNVRLDEGVAVKHLRQGLDLPQATQQLADRASTVQALTQVLAGMEAPTSDVTQVLASVEGWRGKDLDLAVIDSLAIYRPKFVYFGDYDSMPGKVSIPHLIAARTKGTLTRGEEAVLALLSMAGVDLEDFQEPESHEHLIRDLENASNSISSEVFEYWTQNKNLSVRLDIIGTPEPGAAAPFDQAPLLQIRVVNQRHNVSVPFDERSRGFVWFFSFLAYFTHLEEDSKQQLILLLDEPGLNLHATAQADLLRFIDERLAPTHQVLFSTHSPFMINAHKFGRVRTVVDDEKKGTIVSADVLRADAETAFPLHATLGIELSQTLFVGPNVLLVEGPGDLLYLEVLSDTLKSANREGLDEALVITPAGGIAKLPAFIGLLGSNGLNTIALVDTSSNDTTTIRRLREAGRLGGGGIVEIGTVLERADADIEDLFEPGFYVELINDAYQGLLNGKKLTVKELPDDPRLVRRVERAFESRGINNGRINHFAPAAALNRKQSHYVPKINDKTLDRAEKLFAAINLLVPRD
ncbi:AAA family ATPase (plasmid) [Arthrobacter agilis]|uniref:AAA family ATPase n=1 Tax=Arthrobacter agilis TaxID=37921 RepID=UPI00236643EA|nr:AAA family ATPase [Arthrobacter agilis]WDF35211.1 AAA family ATPase [Arthrobacter agilis]